MPIGSYKDLIAGQRAMDLVEAVYRLSDRFPARERFGLSAQVGRAAVSIPANVAEGYSRPTRTDYTRFLDIALGSANEVETHVLVSHRLGFAPKEQADTVLALTGEVQRLVAALASGLRGGAYRRAAR